MKEFETCQKSVWGHNLSIMYRRTYGRGTPENENIPHFRGVRLGAPEVFILSVGTPIPLFNSIQSSPGMFAYAVHLEPRYANTLGTVKGINPSHSMLRCASSGKSMISVAAILELKGHSGLDTAIARHNQ